MEIGDKAFQEFKATHDITRNCRDYDLLPLHGEESAFPISNLCQNSILDILKDLFLALSHRHRKPKVPLMPLGESDPETSRKIFPHLFLDTLSKSRLGFLKINYLLGCPRIDLKTCLHRSTLVPIGYK